MRPADREAASPFQRNRTATRIHEVNARNLEVIPDEGGRLMEMLPADAETEEVRLDPYDSAVPYAWARKGRVT